jgi:D-alanine--poly(phosphoribitol) ligase subunit 2
MTQDNHNIKNKIRDYVFQATFADKDKISDSTLIFREGFFDSMGFLKLITFIEEEFDAKTIDADLVEKNFESINAITDFIYRKVP